MIHPFIQYKESEGKGLGVFATEDIPVNALIEIAPVIVLPKEERAYIDKTKLYKYYFAWGEKQDQTAIALGYISLYNHKVDANCLYETFFEEKQIQIITRKVVAKGEELNINYHHNPMSKKATWFNAI